MENKKFHKIEFTGERMLNHPDSMMYKTSIARYRFVENFIKDKSVLDMACGSGYGSRHLAEIAGSVVGADVDQDTIDHCRQKYAKSNLEFKLVEKDCTVNNFLNKFDIIVSFETIEHTDRHEFFLNNLKAYAKENGTIILSLPIISEKLILLTTNSTRTNSISWSCMK